MALPKISQPLFELKVPSTNKKVKYRPFTVKEEKILLIAQESKDFDQIILSIKQIISNCVEGIDVDKLAMFDLEYILINIRAKSVNNKMNFRIRDPETSETIDMELDINEINIEKKPNHNKIISIDDNTSIAMAYPKIESLKKLSVDGANEETLFQVMLDCIESVVDGEEVHMLKDFTEEEVNDFTESLSSIHLEKIKEFFETMPVLRYEKKYKTKDGKEKTFVAEGTETFFI